MKRNKKALKIEPQNNIRNSVIKKKSFIKRLLIGIKNHKYTILYIVILAVLWTYIIINWELCINMQLFSQFNGNNILFLVGIILTVLPFYDIEGKGVKLVRRTKKEIASRYNKESSQYDLEIHINKLQSENNSEKENRSNE